MPRRKTSSKYPPLSISISTTAVGTTGAKSLIEDKTGKKGSADDVFSRSERQEMVPYKKIQIIDNLRLSAQDKLDVAKLLTRINLKKKSLEGHSGPKASTDSRPNGIPEPNSARRISKLEEVDEVEVEEEGSRKKALSRRSRKRKRLREQQRTRTRTVVEYISSKYDFIASPRTRYKKYEAISKNKFKVTYY